MDIASPRFRMYDAGLSFPYSHKFRQRQPSSQFSNTPAASNGKPAIHCPPSGSLLPWSVSGREWPESEGALAICLPKVEVAPCWYQLKLFVYHQNVPAPKRDRKRKTEKTTQGVKRNLLCVCVCVFFIVSFFAAEALR